MRRVAGTALAVVALMALGTAPTQAQESAPEGDWAGSTLVPNPRPCDHDDICGQFDRVPHPALGAPDITVYFTHEAVATTVGCELPNPATSGPFRSPNVFNEPVTFECNGTYTSTAYATADRGESRAHRLSRTFAVTNPAPEVDPPTASAGPARSVEITWSPLAGAPKDFRGYAVVRRTDEATETIATLPPTETSWVDVSPPAEGGSITYGVQTRRPGANPAVPTEDVRSSGAFSESVEVEPAPVDPTDPTDPTVPGDPTDPTDPGNPNDPGGPSTPGGPSNPPSGGRSTPAVQVPRVGTPSRSFFPPLLSPPVDAGFSPELPFDEREPGEEAAVLPDDLSNPFTEPGRGLVIPAAIGLVLAVWAFHLRHLAHMARPQYAEAGDDLPEIVRLE